MTLSIDLLATCAAFAIIAVVYYRQRKSSNLPLPPGPKGLPLVGNLFDMPKSFEWETYTQWAKDYNSDIIHVNLAGTSVVILNTAEVANDLFEKRSSIYSSRTRLPMVNELMGWSFNFGFMPYGDFWRKHRKLFHQEFHPGAIARYHPHEIRHSVGMLRRLLDTPDDFLEHFRHMAGALVMSVAYGLDVLPENDPYIAAAKGAVHPATLAMVPGTFLVDAMPMLKHVPEWLPGAGFKTKAKEWKKLAETMWEMPFTAGKKKILQGDAPQSFISFCMEKINENGDVEEQERLIQNCAAAMYIATSDTPVSFLGTFFLAMLHSPEAQRKAQEELDTVIGFGNLPNFDDEESLPYVSALCKEIMRWHPVTPIAVPHSSTEEDVYKGYRIPAGSVVVPNVWSILHNEKDYPNPYLFQPERFLTEDGQLNPNVKDPSTASFGFGRRICPGRFMATSTIWISVAMILSCFDIKKALDTDGKPIEPSYQYVSSMVTIPEDFKVSVKPRSREIETMIRTTADKY